MEIKESPENEMKLRKNKEKYSQLIFAAPCFAVILK